ncbi:hypothetical protein I5Q34_34030 [Streptomyces sp. AV19]|uniref:hypothetical protein n=1 Tax=Streptomyces sp. AV19 TaxID=2793068 RepID=UPI0018FE2228|nr:hypothetical protein [Streptomyces sp. AV19]MBH1939220.1 hypothetical protein [Streptomyces sp. AV19]MDG4537198.1 hypothetical protein [Streptomyces sp. AV19]
MTTTPTTNPPTMPPTPTRAPVFVSHVEPLKRDVQYDHRAAQAALPVKIHYRDGTSAETLLVLTPDQMTLLAIQLERAIKARSRARQVEL